MRIVSLCPSITKLVFDLGRGNDLVGITKYCVHPREAVKGIEKLGGTKNPDTARIRELAPDLVLMNREENRHEDWEALARAGISCHVSLPVTVDDTLAAVSSLGTALDRAQEAGDLVRRIERTRAEVCARAGLFSGLTWAYLIWRKPWMSVNRNTYIHALLSEAGGSNIFAGEPDTYPEIHSDRLAETAPDAVFLSSEPFPFTEKHIRELADATGLQPHRFHLVDGEKLSWHGAFTEPGLKYAASLMAAVLAGTNRG